jgi:myo-inositol 2-dehydrogenase / D-chiro-inositol 1-dehydrogenase
MSIKSRREFLKAGSTAALWLAASVKTPAARGQNAASRSSAADRPRIACIGMRYQGTVIARQAEQFGDVVAICDVDRHVREQARASFGSTPRIYEDYREMLSAGGVEIVMIGTPDHWHAKMLIDACRAGMDVYCEKPLTLTIDEGKVIRSVVRETGRIVQVGAWQRSDHRFRLAVEMVRAGRIGKLQRVDVVLGKNKTGGPFKNLSPPPNINWELWQGQAPDAPYMHERCHYDFRWWHAYSGGQMTDWGAHHLDIVQWAIGEYPTEVAGKARYPNIKDGYDVAIDFEAKYLYPSGVVMTVSDTGRNGILFTGSDGRIFVNRGSLSGKPVEDLTNAPLPREEFSLYPYDNFNRPPRTGKLDAITNHIGNFFDCVATRRQPIADVESQHRSAATCHLGNISMRLDRPMRWNPDLETFFDDAEANSFLKRPQRKEHEVV